MARGLRGGMIEWGRAEHHDVPKRLYSDFRCRENEMSIRQTDTMKHEHRPRMPTIWPVQDYTLRACHGIHNDQRYDIIVNAHSIAP